MNQDEVGSNIEHIINSMKSYLVITCSNSCEMLKINVCNNGLGFIIYLNKFISH